LNDPQELLCSANPGDASLPPALLRRGLRETTTRTALCAQDAVESEQVDWAQACISSQWFNCSMRRRCSKQCRKQGSPWFQILGVSSQRRDLVGRKNTVVVTAFRIHPADSMFRALSDKIMATISVQAL
jgi:hypothetical protein